MIPLAVIQGLGMLASAGSGIANYIAMKKAQQASSRENARAQRVLDENLNEARRDYIRETNTQTLDKADTAHLMREANEQNKRQAEIDTARAAVSGATPEVGALQATVRGRNYTDALSRIAGVGQQRKENALASYSYARARHAQGVAGLATNLAQSHAIASNNARQGLDASVNSFASQLSNIANKQNTVNPSTPAPKLEKVAPTQAQLKAPKFDIRKYKFGQKIY